MPVALQVIRDAGEASALLDPARLQLLESLAEPDSAAGLARRLRLPRQQVNYHLRELEKRGLVEFVEERRRGNCLERRVRAAASQFVVSPEVLGRMGAPPAATLPAPDRYSIAYLVSVAARAIRELATLAVRAAQAHKRLATLTLDTEIRFRSAEDRAAFAAEFTEALVRLTAKYHDASHPGGRAFRCIAGVYPLITRQENDSATPARLE